MNNNAYELDQIQADILKNNVCPDLAHTAKQLVMGTGNSDADIVFIGEAPGKKEDESGMPFVGASGKFLDEMLDSIKLRRKDVYITNIVKYRPPDNRDPSRAEKLAFMPYLLRQIEVIQPKVLVPLGRHAMNVFLPEAVISEAHGKVFPYRIQKAHDSQAEGSSGAESDVPVQTILPIVILPLYHPAAAIYNRKLRETLFTDFAQIPKQLNLGHKQ